MPSSTSSSNQNSTSGSWLRTVTFGLLAALILLGCWEIFWRSEGFTPSTEDDLGIWAIIRKDVQKNDNKSVILLGSSRMQLDVDPQIFQAETGFKTSMLAIDGSSPLPVLADLAERSDFNGLILCSLPPQWLADAGAGKSRSAKWVRKFHKQKWSFWIETRLSLLLQANFVFRYPGLLPGKLWEEYQKKEKPRPPYAPMRNDRYRPADYTMADIAKLRSARIKRQEEIVSTARPLTDQEFSRRINDIEALVHKIQKRGGKVIFLRLPSSDAILSLEERTWPRRKYWDRFAANTSARTLHFADSPQLSDFKCPDGSHLSYHDATLFSRSLVDILDLRKMK